MTCRADDENRTRNRPLTRRVLCRLSYVGISGENTRTYDTPAKETPPRTCGALRARGTLRAIKQGDYTKAILNGEVKQAIKLLPRKGSTGGSLAGISRQVKHNRSIAMSGSSS